MKSALTKQEIRDLSQAAGLPTWNEPASACLSSRIPYHSEVTDEKLRMIEQAEADPARARLPYLSRPPSRYRWPASNFGRRGWRAR